MSYKTRITILFAFAIGWIVGILCIAASMAAAWEASIGVTRFDAQPNGIWYQQGPTTPYKLDLTSHMLAIGATDRFANGLRWRAGAMYLGKARSTAVATASDEDYATLACGGNPCWPLSNWHGEGSVAGLYATLNPERRIGPVTLVGEIGLTLYRPTWTMTIPDWRGCRECPPQYLQVVHKPRLQPGLIAGIGLRLNDRLTIMLNRTTATASHDEWPAIYKHATMLSARWEF